ncbi:MAG: metal-dependent hydrolase [Calditrichota bacterium]
MANFKTHLTSAAALSGILATGLLGANVAGSDDVLVYFTAGTIGGLLPDVDSDNSIILKVLFGIFAVFFSFLLMFIQSNLFSIVELLILWTVFYLFINFVIFQAFSKFTVHRGLFHSIPAAGVAWMAATIFAYNSMEYSALKSWTVGFFVFFGYMIHLILDEIFSVDLENKKIKKSFGTALKLFDAKNIPVTILLYLLIGGGYFFAPSPQRFLDTVFKERILRNLQRNLLPRDGWFRNLRRQLPIGENQRILIDSETFEYVGIGPELPPEKSKVEPDMHSILSREKIT